MESMIRDISLAESGQKKIDWVKRPHAFAELL